MAKCKGCRKMILVQWWGRDPLPLPPKPFTPRSLVGMTMGARKRAWLSGALSAYLFPHRDSTGGEHDTRSDYSWSEIRVDAPYLGTKLGERLRPCPGCPECEHGKHWRCDNCGTTKGLCNLTLAEVRCKCGKGCGQWRISFPAKTVCDGSGVLPARKAKR